MIKRFNLISLILLIAAVFVLIPTRAESARRDSFGITATMVQTTINITAPKDREACSVTPTIMGTTSRPHKNVMIKGTSGGKEGIVAFTISDGNGKFSIEVNSETPLDLGNNKLTPFVSGNPGPSITPVVTENPPAEDEPIIHYPQEGEIIKGRRPTVTGFGQPGETVTLFTKDKDGTITQVGEATVNNDGTFSITPSQDLTANVKQIFVVINNVASSMIDVVFADPYGIIYDSELNLPIEDAVVTIQRSLDGGITWNNAVPGVDIAPTDINPQTTGSDGSYSYLTVNGDFRLVVSRTGYTLPSVIIPMGRPAPGSHGELFTVNGIILNIDVPMDFSGSSLIKLNKTANKSQVSIGDIVTYTITINNEGTDEVSHVSLRDSFPAGLKYMEGKGLLDGNKISEPSGTQTKTFDLGTVPAGKILTLKYQVIVGSGAALGNNENKAWCEYSNGRQISNSAIENVKVTYQSIFDSGTIIGKVFHDRNENGIQDSPKKINGQEIIEEPVPDIQIATEDGTIITTDKEGKFHLQGVKPGRHILRIDERTLPKSALLTTNKAVIIDINPGLMTKVNFGVQFKEQKSLEEKPVKISLDTNSPKPLLNAALFQKDLVLKNNKLKEPAEFRIFTNYPTFIEKWKLEIIEKETRNVIRIFEGTKENIFAPIYWDGLDTKGKLVRTGPSYLYKLTATSKENQQDTTSEKLLTVIELLDDNTEKRSEEELARGKIDWLNYESRINNLEQRNIMIEGETIKVTSNKSNIKTIKIYQDKQLTGQVPVRQAGGLKPSDLIESNMFSKEENLPEIFTEIILPYGEYDVEPVIQEPDNKVTEKLEITESKLSQSSNNSQIKADSNSDNIPAPARNYSQHIKIENNKLFYVGMGETKLGYNFNSGHIESIQYKDGFWAQGKAAFYIKGKILDKYLITSSLDTDRDQNDLFKILDPNKYYPVFGDLSSVKYDAANTQGPLYALIEWDKSSAIWGNYNAGLNDTELSQFNRSLAGAKIHYEDVATTQYGESKTKLDVFQARIRQKATHNEFFGTGGSLYYLKDKNIFEGTDKVKIEVRDKINGLVLSTRIMERGLDYEIDYSQGRIIFWKPISQITESDSIISSQILNGNPVYVIADYEYEPTGSYDESTRGARIHQAVTDYLKIGGTYIDEEQPDKNYVLKGTDATLHLGKDIKLTGEYARSQSEAMGSYLSTDGGLSFTSLSSNSEQGKAFSLKGEMYLFGNVGINSYYKKIGKMFSSPSTASLQGKELMGFSSTLDLSSNTRLRVAHDIQKLLDNGDTDTDEQTPVDTFKTETSTAQIVHEMDKFKLTGEYRRQTLQEKARQNAQETTLENETVAAKADYKVTDNILTSFEQQLTLKGLHPNNQTIIGVTIKANDLLSLRAKETLGSLGNATGLGISFNLNDQLGFTSDFTRTYLPYGLSSDTISLGGRAKLNNSTELHTTYAITGSGQDGNTESLAYGFTHKMNDEFALSLDRTFARNSDSTIQANSYGLAREKDGQKIEGKFSSQISQNSSETSNTNIFGLSGNINDNWALSGSYEKGTVQNINGSQYLRNAAALGLGFVDLDMKTQETKFKASIKLEMRLDSGVENKKQLLSYNALEGKINPDTTLFAKINYSQTKNNSTDAVESQFNELSTGFAYRPVNFDWLNLLFKYSHLDNVSPKAQSDSQGIEQEKSHTLAGEGVFDLTDKWQLSEKLAYKTAEEKISGFDLTQTQTWLMIHRINYIFDRDWQAGVEYRYLFQREARDFKKGFLLEVVRNVGENLQAAIGYNFTDFNDDLTHLNYSSHGLSIRLTGKLSN